MFPISSDLGMIIVINHFPADFAEVFRLGDGSQSRKQKVLEREVRRNVEGRDSGLHQQLTVGKKHETSGLTNQHGTEDQQNIEIN